MANDRDNLVMCVTCGKRVAELRTEEGRVLCSVCKLEEMGAQPNCEADRDETHD